MARPCHTTPVTFLPTPCGSRKDQLDPIHKMPLGASYKVLAVSNGGPATMVETYPTGYQQAKQYNFYSGYTPGVFEADTEGRHTSPSTSTARKAIP